LDIRQQINVLRRTAPKRLSFSDLRSLGIRWSLSVVSKDLRCAGNREAGHHCSLASRGFPVVLALEVETPWWPAEGATRNTPADPRDEHRKSTLGRAAHPRRYTASDRGMEGCASTARRREGRAHQLSTCTGRVASSISPDLIYDRHSACKPKVRCRQECASGEAAPAEGSLIGLSNLWIIVWARCDAAAEDELADRTLDGKLQAGHSREPIDIGGSDSASAEPHVGCGEI
jgi:hypothetical protein